MVAVGWCFAEDIVFTINPADYQNVTFYSKATIESFEGVTSDISGSITVDPALFSAGASASYYY